LSIFKNAEHIYSVLGTMWKQAFANEEMREKFSRMNVTIHFIIREPESDLWIFPDEIVEGKTDRQPVGSLIEMEMKGDTAHKFWMDKLNVTLAIAKREIKARGAINKVLGLLPTIKPLKKLYPDIAQKEGILPE